jgi:hypothetical protein
MLAMDVCTTICGPEDVQCLHFLLRSLREFADLAFCNLLVSCNSKDQSVRDSIVRTCAASRAKSTSIDFFDAKETVDSRQHGESLNRLIARTTSKHIVVVDADVIITSPEWLDFCKRHIDSGCFIVGTPYRRRWKQKHAQRDFPNVWCAMIDGDALRAAGLDMRPDVFFNEMTGKWTLASDIDTSGQLWYHAKEHRLHYVSFSETTGNLPALLRKWSDGNPQVRRRSKSATRRLAHLHSLEFCFPGTDKVCCAHLLHAVGRPDRVNRWRICAEAILDAQFWHMSNLGKESPDAPP